MFELHNAKKYPALGIQKHLCWPVGYSGLAVWGATPEPKQYVSALCSSITIIRGTQKHLYYPVGYNGMGVWGATPEPKRFFFAIVQFEYHHFRYQKPSLLACGVQWCGWLGRHPRTQTILLALGSSNITILGIQILLC